MNTTRQSLFDVWAERPGSNWQGLVEAMSAEAFASIAEQSALSKVRVFIDRVEPLDKNLAIALDNMVINLVCECCDFASVLGYAIARTAPRGLEGLESWLEGAIKYAGLEDGPAKQEG